MPNVTQVVAALHHRVATLARRASLMAVAMVIMNVSTYGFTIVAARMLGPGSYGALASLTSTLLIVAVVQLALQATAARRIASEPEHVAQIEGSILSVTLRVSIGLGVALLVLSPVLNRVLRLDSLGTAALVAVAAVPITLLGGQAGILQGERRWRELATVYMLSGVPRLIVGVALIWWHPSETSAMLGIALGATAPVIAGWWFLRGTRESAAPAGDHAVRDVMRECLLNSQVLLAFFALSNADVIVARNVLDAHDAGLYAGGLILTKAVLFLPQFVVVVAFPSMSTAHERRQALAASLGVVAVIGVAVTAVTALLPQLMLVFVGGQPYAEITDLLWLFAVLGTVLSMLQLMVYSALARQGQRSAYLIWTALVVLVALGLTTSTLGGLLAVVLTTDTALLLALLLISLVVARRQAETPSSAPSQ